ncbi:MAG TPA: cell division protein ZapA [Sphingomonadaceae bacterium]|nr:cell division protein ZapA [Sphingomonadaceae bacterium]
MSNITLTIGGRSYTVACTDGQEAHIAALGRSIDEKLAAMGSAAGQNESRTLLFAALLLADEVHELKNGPAKVADDKSQPGADELEAIAARLEKLAAALEA